MMFMLVQNRGAYSKLFCLSDHSCYDVFNANNKLSRLLPELSRVGVSL